MYRNVARRLVFTLAVGKNETEKCFDKSALWLAFRHNKQLASRRTGITSITNGRYQFVLSVIESFFRIDHAIVVDINGDDGQSGIRPSRALIISIADIAHANAVDVIGHLSCDPRVAIHAGAQQILLMGAKPGGEGLCFVPMLIRSMDEVAKKIPRGLLESSYSLGSTRIETIGIMLTLIVLVLSLGGRLIMSRFNKNKV